MKSGMQIAFLVALSAVVGIQAADHTGADRTIGKVVKLLDQMLEKSKEEEKEEKEIFGTFKCHCETESVAKAASIKAGTQTISLLQAKIEQTQGNSGELSSDIADLQKKMDDNTEARRQAAEMREGDEGKFGTAKGEMEAGINSMKAALLKLAEVGADATTSGAQNLGTNDVGFLTKSSKVKKGSKGSLLGLKTSISKALVAASAFLTPTQKKAAASFLQQPLGGTYSSQSTQVVGILTNMQDTFKANLAEAIATETKAAADHLKLKKIKEDAFGLMQSSRDEKSEALGENDGALSAAKGQLEGADGAKTSDERLLGELESMCSTKTKAREDRKLLRASEEAAISQAISILNSDAAFATFGSTAATSTGLTGFLQLSSTHRHYTPKATRVAKIVALQESGNPFDVVLDEVKKMINVIEAEGVADQTKWDFCKEERRTNNAAIGDKDNEVIAQKQTVDGLIATISHETTGLKVTIASIQTALDGITADQAAETKTRSEEQLAYQKDTANLSQADALLEKAIKVLKVFYDALDAKLNAASQTPNLLQKKKQDPAAPEYAYGAYEAQKNEAGSSALEMLKFVKSEGVKDMKEAHDDELAAQHLYEESMASMLSTKTTEEGRMTRLQGELAEKQKELLLARKNLKTTKAARVAIREYLASIKSGCDFINNKKTFRDDARGEELASLRSIDTQVKDTPAYKAAELAALELSQGACKEKCAGTGSETAQCKACLADVTVKGYCISHPGVEGC